MLFEGLGGSQAKRENVPRSMGTVEDMVQSKRLLAQEMQQGGERPKRKNSGDMRPRSRRMPSEESAYTTDETSDEEEKRPPTPPRKTCKAPRRWQPCEDRRLAESVKQHGEANWKAIAARVGSRNHVQCLQRWKKVLRPGLVKGQWSAEEDAVLMKLASSGYKNWGVLSNHMPGRTSKQCRERWCHHLDPSINKGAYTQEEDKIILETQAKIGNKWSQIAARLPGRTENSIKIRCKALQRRGGANQSTPTSPRNLSPEKSSPAGGLLSRARDVTTMQSADEGHGALGKSLSSSFSHCLPQEYSLRSASTPLMCPPKPQAVAVPLCHQRPMFAKGGAPTGAVPTMVTSDSYTVQSPFLDLVPPPSSVAMVDDTYEDCLKWSRTTAPASSSTCSTLPVRGSLWSPTITLMHAVKGGQLESHALIPGTLPGPAHTSGAEPHYTSAPANPVPMLPRHSSNSVAHPQLTGFFPLCSSGMVSDDGGNHGQQPECPTPMQVGPVASVSMDISGTSGGHTMKAETNGLGEDLGDLSTLDVKDLKDLQAAVGGEDEEAAPLRSCCSFLDLPGDGMVVGEMPLTW